MSREKGIWRKKNYCSISSAMAESECLDVESPEGILQ